MERWRSFFGSSGEDLWTVIDRAITIAAIDYPQELRVRRDAFAEKLFAPASHFSSANIGEVQRLDVRVENLFGPNLCPLTSSIGERPALTRSDGRTGASPESESKDGLEGQQKDPEAIFHDSTVLANCKSLENKALTEESKESLQIREILAIKQQILNSDQDALKVLYQRKLSTPPTEETFLFLLSKLEDMNICVPALKATGIGKPVNGLRKHASRRVRSVAKRLVSLWKDVVDEWVSKQGEDFATAFVDSGTSDTYGNEIGTVSPCLNNNALPSNGIRSPKILAVKDNDFSAGSWRMENVDHRHIAAKHTGNSIAEECQLRSFFQSHPQMSSTDIRLQKCKLDHENNLLDRELIPRSGDVVRSKKDMFDFVGGVFKASADHFGNSCNKLDAVDQSNLAHRSPDLTDAVQKQKVFNNKPRSDMKAKPTVNASNLHWLELAKQTLHENYQQAEKVKKQRTIQVVDADNASGLSTQPKSHSTGHEKPVFNMRKACPSHLK